jgi:hypothetical protein
MSIRLTIIIARSVLVISPTSSAIVIGYAFTVPHMHVLRWGLVPLWLLACGPSYWKLVKSVRRLEQLDRRRGITSEPTEQ